MSAPCPTRWRPPSVGIKKQEAGQTGGCPPAARTADPRQRVSLPGIFFKGQRPLCPAPAPVPGRRLSRLSRPGRGAFVRSPRAGGPRPLLSGAAGTASSPCSLCARAVQNPCAKRARRRLFRLFWRIAQPALTDCAKGRYSWVTFSPKELSTTLSKGTRSSSSPACSIISCSLSKELCFMMGVSFQASMSLWRWVTAVSSSRSVSGKWGSMTWAISCALCSLTHCWPL